MSHTRSSKDRAEREGGYSYECFDWNGNLFRAEGGFATAQEADRAAECAEREMTLQHMAPARSSELEALLSDEELMRELGL